MKPIRYLLTGAVVSFFSITIHTNADDPMASLKRTTEPATPQATYDDIRSTLGIVPSFLRAYPPASIAGAWSEMKAIQLNPKTAIAPKYKELIGLAVASQIPCTYCTQFHSEAAKLNGGNEAELQEAVAVASCARHWSTFFNGTLTDEARFRSDVDTIMAKMKERTTKSNEKAAASTVSVNTPEEALTDIEQTLGIVPEFIRAFPKEGLAAAWNDLKSLELNANTAIPSRQKALISLAVDAQVPCRYCVYWDTASAKAEGATDQEISEAVALASITRKWSTVLNGVRTDPESFSKEVAQIIAHGKEQKTVQ